MGYPILVFAPQGTPLTPKAFEVASAAQAKYGVKITIEAERTLLPLIRQKLGDLGIDIDSLRIIE